MALLKLHAKIEPEKAIIVRNSRKRATTRKATSQTTLCSFCLSERSCRGLCGGVTKT